MKKKSPPYAIIVAAILGIIAVAVFFQYEKRQKEAADAQIAAANAAALAAEQAAASKQTSVVNVTPTPTNMREVLYATQPVAPGQAISPAFFEKKMTPSDLLPDAYPGDTDVVGWFAIRQIEKGDPLTPRNIGKSLPYMTQRISPGMRSITLPVFNTEPVNATGGFMVDGDRADLLGTEVSPDGKFEYNTQLVMQNLKILFVPGSPVKTDQTDGVNPVGPSAITFEVTPEQAEMLVFMGQAKEIKFSMILRARNDNTEINIKPFKPDDYDWENLKKVQKVIDKSQDRVKKLADEIAAAEKNQGQGTTNETTTPIPPSP